MKLFIVGLFDAIQHGDREHREWLRDALIKYVNKKLAITSVTKDDFTIRDN